MYVCTRTQNSADSCTVALKDYQKHHKKSTNNPQEHPIFIQM